MFYSTSIPSLDFRESQTGETPMRRSSLVDSYIGHVGERERETVKERRGDSTQGLSLEREKDRSPRERNGSSILRSRGHFRGRNARLFSTLRSPSFTFGKRERKSCAPRDPRKTTIFCSITDRPNDRPTDRWSVQTTRLSGANLISGRRREESLPTPRIRWRASKQLNYSLLHAHRYFHISRLNSL